MLMAFFKALSDGLALLILQSLNYAKMKFIACGAQEISWIYILTPVVPSRCSETACASGLWM